MWRTIRLSHSKPFFTGETRPRRMEESEIHLNRLPMAGVVRELESYSNLGRNKKSEKQAAETGYWCGGANDNGSP